MDFVTVNNQSIASPDAEPTTEPNELSFKQCLISSVWSQSRLVASLLDQSGIPYHRVIEAKALELFIILINTELSTAYLLNHFNTSSLNALNDNLLQVQSNVLSSLDMLVVEAFSYQDKNRKKTPVIKRLLGQHHDWKHCAKSRFERVICTVLEKKLYQAQSLK